MPTLSTDAVRHVASPSLRCKVMNIKDQDEENVRL